MYLFYPLFDEKYPPYPIIDCLKNNMATLVSIILSFKRLFQ